MTNRSWMTVTVGAIVLAVALAVAWWAYKESQKRELERNVVALVQDSTARLRDAFGLLPGGVEVRPQLEAHFAALDSNVAKTQALNASIYPALIRAATAYITDVQALMRRELDLHAGREAVGADIGEIENHLRAAGTRSPEWIQHALELHQKLDKSFFNYRFAAGGLEKSLRSLEETSLGLRIFVPAPALIDENALEDAHKSLMDLSAQVEQQVKNAKTLPTG